MCGIFAVSGAEKASAEIFLGLLHLQHRGQDATGAITVDNSGQVHRHKAVGLVSDAFTEEQINKLDGNMGIGHTRYTTAGIGSFDEVQPFFVRRPHGIGLAFNGNIVNYPILRKKMQSEGNIYFSSNSDAEVLVQMFAGEYEKDDSVEGAFKAIKKLNTDTIGAYAGVMIIANKGILAFKDPNGIRPLMMGSRKINGKENVAFASESVALTIQGYNNIQDLQPGEAVFVDIKGKVHKKIIKADKPAPCIFEWVYFSTAESVVGGIPVYNFRKKLGVYLARKIKDEYSDLDIDVVIPVPDTARTAAMSLARELGILFEEGLIKNRYVGRTFIMPAQKIRDTAVKLKLKPIQSVIKGKNVMVVDDSIVRGTTSRRIVRLLKETGAKKVYFVSTYPPIRNPCYYGIDFQHPDELIANGKEVEEIEKELGADKLIFMDIPGLEEAMESKNMCKACISDEYPTSIEQSKELASLRKKHQAQSAKC